MLIVCFLYRENMLLLDRICFLYRENMQALNGEYAYSLYMKRICFLIYVSYIERMYASYRKNMIMIRTYIENMLLN